MIIKNQSSRGLIITGNSAHSVLIVGYDQEHFYFNDPYTGKRKKMTFKAFWKIASYQGHRAMTY
ncbi:papain-like cysteine protease family protein [Latilactobacillus sakei]